MLYRLLPKIIQKSYIHHKSRKFCWLRSIRDFLWVRKSFLDTWFCRLARDKLFIVNICPYQHNRLRKGNYSMVGTCRDRRVAISQGTDRECRLVLLIKVPHILRGASSSRKIGCCMKIYLLFTQRAFIYPSSRLTCLGTLDVLTERSLSITLSTLMSSLRYMNIYGIFII